jgi:hypothetical protein
MWEGEDVRQMSHGAVGDEREQFRLFHGRVDLGRHLGDHGRAQVVPQPVRRRPGEGENALAPPVQMPGDERLLVVVSVAHQLGGHPLFAGAGLEVRAREGRRHPGAGELLFEPAQHFSGVKTQALRQVVKHFQQVQNAHGSVPHVAAAGSRFHVPQHVH